MKKTKNSSVRIELPDINVLLALVDPNHMHHATASQWFMSASQNGWATCPLTENGFIRILSNPKYPGIRLRVADAVALLDTLIQNHATTHHFWADTVSLCDQTLFRHIAIAGPNQITDVYLLGLCQRNNGTLVTLDASITDVAIVSPNPTLIHRL